MPYHAAYQLPFKALDIVVVEDSPHMRQILHSVLASFGVRRLRLFSCGQTALNEMVNDPPNLLITDWRMKPMDGYQLLQTIRRSNMMPLSLLPVIMVTGFASRQFVQTCFDAGVQQFLVKPVSPKTIYERIHWILSDSRFLTCQDGVYCLDKDETVSSNSCGADIGFLDLPEDRLAQAYEPDERLLAVNDPWQI